MSTPSNFNTSRPKTLVSTMIPTSKDSSHGMYSLKWNAFESHISFGLGKLLADDEYTDVTLACEGRYLKAHKFLLSLCSPFFKLLFQQGNSNGKYDNTIIILSNVPFEDLENILMFIYNGETNVRQSDFESFLHTAETLQIEGLSSSSQYNEERQSEKESGSSFVETQVNSRPHSLNMSTISKLNKTNEIQRDQDQTSSPSPGPCSPGHLRLGASSISPNPSHRIDFDNPQKSKSPVTIIEEVDDTDEIMHDRNEEDATETTSHRRFVVPGYHSTNRRSPAGHYAESYYENNRNVVDIRDLPVFRSRNFKSAERKKTSALWDYFKYDEQLDFVSCQLQKDGRSCTFSAKHKPLSNMKYHVRTCHRKEYEIILPRLLNKH